MRETIFSHRLGGSVTDLPLLVPSFSSKGFDFFTEKHAKSNKVFSRTTYALEDFARYLQETYLLSSYDIHHNHFRQPGRFFSNTALIFLDSGGYELASEFDSSEPKITPVRQLSFSEDDYTSTLKGLYKKYKNKPFVIANYDWGTRRKPFEDQIRNARTLFSKFPEWATNFILKPNTPNGTKLHFDTIFPIIEELRSFDIIGVTEKELGKNLMDRLKLIAKLRAELNKRNINKPIHVWGGLDPIITPLYFFAGADIFDGVSWLRYAYHNGMAVNRESAPVLSGNIAVPNDHSIALAINNNLMILQGLATSLRSFANSSTPNFEMFDGKGEYFEKAYRTMLAKIPEIEELSQ